MAYHQYFPQPWLDLQVELSYHPDCILAVMSATDYVQANPFEHRLEMGDPQTAFLVKLAAICAYCSMAVDGEYTPAEVDRLCTACTEKLMTMRKEWRVDHHE